MAIVKAVNKWRNYLLGRKFRIQTDHCSLKYILEQRITTMDQQRWMVKLMGFHYEIEYRPSRENKAADAISWLQGEVSAISCPTPTWLEAVRIEARTHPALECIKKAFVQGDICYKDYRIMGELLWHKGRLVLPFSSQYKETIIREFHDTPVGGHSRILRTFKRLTANFFWLGMKKDVQNFVQQCDIYQ